MTTINPAFITLAQNYLETKERTPHYEIRSISDCCPADGWCNLQSFSKEEMAQLLALREKYGKEEFYNHLDEVFDEDTLHALIYGSETIGFDLDTEYYMYSFTCHQVTPKGLVTGKVKINLLDKDLRTISCSSPGKQGLDYKQSKICGQEPIRHSNTRSRP